MTAFLRTPAATDDKYTRGVLGVRTGAPQYPGAAVLGITAAWRTGIGMVRYVPADAHDDSGSRRTIPGLTPPAAAVLAARPETVFGEGRADAWLVGSGTDPATRGFAEREALARLLRGEAPVVVDAGALQLAAESALGGETAPLILTPHRGEFARIWGIARLGPLPEGWPGRHPRGGATGSGLGSDPGRETAVLAEAAARLAQALGVTVLLKGSTTFAAGPTGDPLLVGPATPWLATAGTGDVLAGILGALVASHAAEVRSDPALLRDLGATAAQLHDAAARIAAGGDAAAAHLITAHPITALDVADAIPAAVADAIPTAIAQTH